jgi:hypothetical protein
MPLYVLGNEGLQQGALLGVEFTVCDEVVGQAAGLVQRPRLKRGDELTLIDHSDLQGQQPKQEMVVGSHGSPPLHLRRRPDPLATERRSVGDRMNVSARF